MKGGRRENEDSKGQVTGREDEGSGRDAPQEGRGARRRADCRGNVTSRPAPRSGKDADANGEGARHRTGGCVAARAEKRFADLDVAWLRGGDGRRAAPHCRVPRPSAGGSVGRLRARDADTWSEAGLVQAEHQGQASGWDARSQASRVRKAVR